MDYDEGAPPRYLPQGPHHPRSTPGVIVQQETMMEPTCMFG